MGQFTLQLFFFGHKWGETVTHRRLLGMSLLHPWNFYRGMTPLFIPLLMLVKPLSMLIKTSNWQLLARQYQHKFNKWLFILLILIIRINILLEKFYKKQIVLIGWLCLGQYKENTTATINEVPLTQCLCKGFHFTIKGQIPRSISVIIAQYLKSNT